MSSRIVSVRILSGGTDCLRRPKTASRLWRPPFCDGGGYRLVGVGGGDGDDGDGTSGGVVRWFR